MTVIVSIATSVFRSCFAVLVFSFIVLIEEKISVEFREYVGNALVASMCPDSFLVCVMRTFFVLVLMLPIDLIPMNSSRISSIFSCLLDLLLSLIPRLIFLLMSVTSALFLCVLQLQVWVAQVFSLSLSLALFVCDCCRRRHMILLKSFCHIFCCCRRSGYVLLFKYHCGEKIAKLIIFELMLAIS